MIITMESIKWWKWCRPAMAKTFRLVSAWHGSHYIIIGLIEMSVSLPATNWHIPMTHAKYKAKVRNIPYIVESVTLKKGFHEYLEMLYLTWQTRWIPRDLSDNKWVLNRKLAEFTWVLLGGIEQSWEGVHLKKHHVSPSRYIYTVLLK